ncbi:hypothetical protein JXQ70_16900 [bacterium]|nr:hypothetical protein [bacterium]
MSWDAFIFNGEGVPRSLQHVAQDWHPQPIGSSSQAKSMISSVLADVVWDAAGYGIFETLDYAIEFHVRDEETVDSIGVRIVGDGDPIPVLFAVCRAHGWVIFDNQAGDLIDQEADPSSSWRKFTEWRDRVITQMDEE